VSERIYCSDAARLRGDDNTATAARVDTWLVVELPAPWGRNPLNDSALPPPVREALLRAHDELKRSRIVFIRGNAPRPHTRVIVAGSGGRNPGMTTRELASINDVAEISFTEMLSEVAPPARPLVMVCTHGQRDSCCGRRGYPLYDALRRREELDVWQCSHIGGDRFAANVVVLPWGLYYGPVEPHTAPALTDAITRNEIYLPAYRGRSPWSRPVQAAETFIRQSTGLTAIDALQFVGRAAVAEDRTTVTLREGGGKEHTVTIDRVMSEEKVALTCGAREGGRAAVYRVGGRGSG
jgi:hypothetical protein